MVKVKRVYEPAEPSDGARYLVERLWPRGIKKENLKMEAWLKDVAPSAELRRWFSHDPQKWEEFQRRYRSELTAEPSHWKALLEAGRQGDVTLLYSARDVERNSAVLLQAFLAEKLATHQPA